jgi:hypothetical protein
MRFGSSLAVTKCLCMAARRPTMRTHQAEIETLRKVVGKLFV